MAEVQQQLQNLKSRLDIENQAQFSDEEKALVDKVEQLKEEFRELLAELRRKRAAQGSSILSDDVSGGCKSRNQKSENVLFNP